MRNRSRLQPRAMSGGGVGAAVSGWRASNPRSRRLEGGRAIAGEAADLPCAQAGERWRFGAVDGVAARTASGQR